MPPVILVLALFAAPPATVSVAPDPVEARAAALGEDPANAGFTVVAVPPFVVIGDESPDAVARRAGVVRWALDRLRARLFDRAPAGPIEVWLFRDRDSYRRHARERFGVDEPPTPYGWYDASRRALIMNIATGDGTLVHELVHPLVEANAPGCPAWIDEGLGTLFEQCADRDGRIVGLVNWRLAGLRATIRRDALPSVERLATMPDADFRAATAGDPYAQSRHVMLWLQEHGRLGAFWRGWLATRDADPRGTAALRAAVGADDLDAWERQWRSWVLALPEP